MKKQAFYLLVFALFQTISSFAQLDSINHLEEVLLSDVHLTKNSRGQLVQVLNDSVIEHNSPSLTSILRFNTPLYFKENGPGMVSSVSFRGTTASQTAVIWNGINVNSQFTGQTDFNTLITANYDNISIRSGGGSVLYGSGAIGGSVHLNDYFEFDEGFSSRLRLEAGSFETFFGSYTGKYSSERAAVQFNVAGIVSENNFKYPGTEKVNTNGDYDNFSGSFSAAHIFDDSNTIKFYTNYFSGERGFSGTLFAPSNSKYEDINSRNLVEWKNFSEYFISSLKLAYLDETYRYFENRHREEYSLGRAKSGILKYDLEYKIKREMSLTGIFDLQYTAGTGTNIGEEDRKTGSLGFLFAHELGSFGYEASLRKEVTENYDSPLLFSLGANYFVTDNYDLKLNFSRNYRIPTFNDLFWFAGGNRELQPEESLQAELSHNLNFRKVSLALTTYVIQINNLLRWVPGGGGLWRPENTESVRNYGAEFLASVEQEFGDHRLLWSGIYAFTKTEDLNLEKSLIYTPQHKITSSVAYGYKGFSLYYQFLYTGSVYTSADNYYSLPSYSVSNIGLEYSFPRNEMLSLGMEVENLWNENYQIMPSRPMPGRSFNSILTLNF